MSSSAPSRPCPCTSGKKYGECCAPLHEKNRFAGTPNELVRARYAAFALGRVDYLYDTLHEDHPDRGRGEDEVRIALRTASSSFKYMGLVMIETEGPDSDGVARALYLARLFRKGTDVSFIELASFHAPNDGEGLKYRSGKTIDAVGLRTAPPGLTLATFEP